MSTSLFAAGNNLPVRLAVLQVNGRSFDEIAAEQSSVEVSHGPA
jgi:hypothetical protein